MHLGVWGEKKKNNYASHFLPGQMIICLGSTLLCLGLTLDSVYNVIFDKTQWTRWGSRDKSRLIFFSS